MTNKLEIESKYGIYIFGHSITAVRATSGETYLPLSSLCKILGLNPRTEIATIKKHTVLADGLRSSTSYFLQFGLVPFWLGLISTDSIEHESLRDEIKQYQEEVSAHIQTQFMGGRLLRDVLLNPKLDSENPLGKIYQEAIELILRLNAEIISDTETLGEEAH